MRRAKILIAGDGIEVCFGQLEAIEKIRNMNASAWVDQASQGTGYVGFDLKTGETVENPGPTVIALYELPKNSTESVMELHGHFRQDFHRLQIEIEKRVNSFYERNCQLT